ncbi:MAG: exo-alpha-sialidase [Candidatus Eisenbacteria bacterium]|uniref:Exo-alpha-sialidase n=1 Tax=Eiseniibacteriota bacterium TaxID=2212470 RepID=A0A538UB97_UNCEI|nr:MAG: exo-alpha-sialidase [Candidatus Eisenbacteria bacterium]
MRDRLRSSRGLPRPLLVSGLTLLLGACGALAPRPAAAAGAARLSNAGQRLFEASLAEGRLGHHPLAAWVRERQRLEAADLTVLGSGDTPRAPAPDHTLTAPNLAYDILVNDKSGITSCGACPNGFLGQAETSIAAHGRLVVASWNDNKARCQGLGTQGMGYSVDRGGTWFDLGSLPVTDAGTRFRGDPVAMVNANTDEFYVVGLDQGPGVTGVAITRGHIDGASWVTDATHHVATGLDNDFLDKPWMAVDSLSGNVYVTWTNFTGTGEANIEMQRFDAVLNPLGPRQVVYVDPLQGSQGSYTVAGPAGEVYVPWTSYVESWSPLFTQLLVRRSDDFGATFGPVQTIAAVDDNAFSGGPGSRRGFGTVNVAAAVDRSVGPHRGRLHVVWDECLHYKDAPFTASTAAVSLEKDDFFASANPFTVGGKLRGTIDFTNDIDYFKFTGAAGQTFVLHSDSLSLFGANFNLRLLCGTDTIPNNWRVLVGSQADPRAGGMVFTLPSTGTYYLQCDGTGAAGPNSYALSTAWDTPTPGERGRDERDQFAAYSDDGTTWSTPVRLNDDPPRFDGCFPSVTVDGTGRVHAFSFSWRNDPVCGALSDQYLTSSGDGGATWGANRRVTDVTDFWSIFASCTAANHGDYEQLTSDGDDVLMCFPDSRLGDPDVFVDVSRLRADGSCVAATTLPAGTQTHLTFSLANDGNFATPLSWALTDDGGWLTGAQPALAGTVSLPGGGGSQPVVASFHVPPDCAGDSSVIHFVVADPFIPGRYDTCQTVVHCGAPTAVDEPGDRRLALGTPRPIPTSGAVDVEVSLPDGAAAALEVVDVGGRLLFSRPVGDLGPGRHLVRLEETRGAPAGVYWLRLRHAGQATVRRMMIVE